MRFKIVCTGASFGDATEYTVLCNGDAVHTFETWGEAFSWLSTNEPSFQDPHHAQD